MSPDYPLELKAGARALPFPWGHCPGWVAWDHGRGLSAYIGPTCLTVLHHQEALTGRSCHPPPGSLHPSTSGPWTRKPKLVSQAHDLLLHTSCLPPPAICPTKANPGHLFQASNGTPYLLLHKTPTNPLNVWSGVASSEKPT